MRASCARHQPEVKTNATAEATPGGKAQGGPRGRDRQGHPQREDHDRHQGRAHQPGPVGGMRDAQPAPQPRLEGAQQGADEVAEIVGAGQPARARQVHRVLGQHHGQQGGEGEAADAHRDGECDGASERDAPGRERRRLPHAPVHGSCFGSDRARQGAGHRCDSATAAATRQVQWDSADAARACAPTAAARGEPLRDQPGASVAQAKRRRA